MNRMRTIAARLRPRTFRAVMVLSIAVISMLMMTAVVIAQNVIVAHVAAEQNMAVMCVSSFDPSDSSDGTGSGSPDAASEDICDKGAVALGDGANIDVFDQSDSAQYSFGIARTVDSVTSSFVNTMRASSIVMMIVFGLLALGVAWIVGTKLSNRVAGVGRQVEALSPDDLHARIDYTYGHDEIGRLVTSINGLLDRVQAASEAERRFVSNASHELRTPIAAVETNLDAPLSQGRFPADVEPSVRRALAANRRGAQLVQALLTLSRIQNDAIGGYRPEPDMPNDGADAAMHGRTTPQNATDDTAGTAGTVRTTNLTGCVHDMIDDVADDAATHGITVHADDLPAVRVAAGRALLELAVGNLVRNAVMHNMDGGSIDVTITTKGDESGHDDGTAAGDGTVIGGVTLTVTNTTDERLPDDLDELTQPFHRGEHSRISAVTGVGLGLSIADAACDAMGATLTLSRPDPVTFRAAIRFPR
ncbi:sensor histidine kinase [Bifidobacterium aerophilum]|uniref:histidine kinase n=1 Tax=Bifidobacterium aerophilum TaxID=1798155 RepID=A0A6N9Z519_9BIFI|nr:HAMP domain-containing sensor histidine kinase [Bifidobacterium aerophilum]NEG89243.1 HAMP domain-containing protein [Bifidobacterium aerophilum]